MSEAQSPTSAHNQGNAAPEGGQTAVAHGTSHRGRNAVIVLIVAVVWLACDVATKNYFGALQTGEVIDGPLPGIFQFRLVHNTGAAWGIFDNMTFVLGIFALIVCVVVLIYLFAFSPRASVGETIGIGLVVAGGIGNAIDRFVLGYVIDFIDFTFIDFPVFNIADTGVTCGIVIFIISLIVRWARESRHNRQAA